jgi:type I restriction enzyme S subunit
MGGEWEKVRLGDLVKITHGWPFKSECFTEERTGRPIIVSIGNFKYTGGFRFESTTIKEYTAAYPKEYELTPGDILLVMTCQTSGGEILGIPGRIPNDGNIYLHNQRMGKVVIKDRKRIDTGFVYYLALWSDFNRELCVSASGTKILHTAPVRIEAFEFNLPPLAEQKAIAAVLGALDDKIELNRRMNATLEAMARALFQSWFVDFDPVRAKMEGRQPAGMDAETAALFPEHFAHGEHEMLPAGWRLATIEEVCAINAWTLGQNDDLETLEYVEISEVSRGNIANIATYPRGEEPSRARRRLRHGDTVLSTVRPDRGSYFLALNPPENRVASTGFAVLTPTKVPWSFVHAALTQPEVSDHLGQMADGGAYPAVRPEVIGAMQVAVPNEPKIFEAFHRFCAPLFEQAEANRTKSHTLATLRDTLLPKLLRGELSVAEAAHEKEGRV